MILLLLWACLLSAPLCSTTASIITINWTKSEIKTITSNIFVGDIVNWVWADSLPHGIRSIDAKFSSSTIVAELGYNYSVQFWGTGVFAYECSVHSTMLGSITVSTAPDEPTLSPTAFSTPVPDLSSTLVVPKVMKSGQALPAKWTLRLEVRATTIYINEYISFNTRSFCYLKDCRLIGPTLQVKAGDVVTLIVENYLENNLNSSDPSLPKPNTTRFYMHGLHTETQLAFEEIRPGTSKEFELDISLDHATGVHWYTSDTPGAAALHAMNGLLGAFYVEPQRLDDVPFAIQNAISYIMVVTKLVVVQETERSEGEVTQGCSTSSTCDSTVQSPLCSGKKKLAMSPYDLYPCKTKLSLLLYILFLKV